MQTQSDNQGMLDDIRQRLDKPVALVGLMGVGKTRLGRMLARSLGLGFVDSDHEIEKAAGMEIVDIFEKFGEDYFRDGECRVIERLLEGNVRVIATGGGAITNEDTASLLWEKAITIWVKADLEIMVERTSRNDKRPLLKAGDSGKILSKLMEDRYPIYETANITVESNNGPAQRIVDKALNGLDVYLRSEAIKS